MTVEEKLAAAAAKGRSVSTPKPKAKKPAKKRKKAAKRKAKPKTAKRRTTGGEALERKTKRHVARCVKSEADAKRSPSPLNDWEKRNVFVSEYLVDLNATQAAIRAGYKESSARTTGSELLADPDIAAAVRERIRWRCDRIQLSQDRVALELARLSFSQMDDFAEWRGDEMRLKDLAELPPGATSCIQEISQTTYPDGKTKLGFKLHGKGPALKLLGQHLAMYVERKDVTGQVEVGSLVDAIKAAARAEEDSD